MGASVSPWEEATNPGGYVAIAHYDDTHARLLRRDGRGLHSSTSQLNLSRF
jgi:hypothetical protein